MSARARTAEPIQCLSWGIGTLPEHAYRPFKATGSAPLFRQLAPALLYLLLPCSRRQLAPALLYLLLPSAYRCISISLYVIHALLYFPTAMWVTPSHKTI
jgi:hypothetical protein